MAKTLTVFLAADLRRFNGGMRDAQRQVTGFGGTLRNNLGPALIGAGIAAGALAVKLGVDGVKAAMEDEKAAALLARTLHTLGLAHDVRPVEAFINSLERAYGVSDLELRPAYDRLIRSIGDTEQANRVLKIAMDISAGTGKSLSAVTDALGRAYDGNTQSLQRLGIGLSRTELSTMSLDKIVDRLADTFQGAADVEARTFEGQLRRLGTATDNLKEAFGIGLLGALGDTGDATDDLVAKFQSMERSITIAGAAVGKAFQQAVKEGAELSKLFGLLIDPGATLSFILQDIAIDLQGGTREMKEMQRAANELRLELALLGGQPLIDKLIGTPQHQRMAAEAMRGVSNEVAAAGRYYQDAAVRAQRLANEQTRVTETNNNVARSTRGASRAKDEYTKKQQRLIDLGKIQGSVLETSKRELIDQIGVLEEATKAVEDYADAIQQDLLRGFDLGGLYEGSLDEQGRFSADRFFASFDDAINKAEWFGGVLQALKARNVDQRLIEQIASLGPDVGGNLAEEMLTGDGAMVQTLVDKWNRIQDTTRELAMGLVPEFLTAGRESAIDTLNGMAEQFRRDQRRFARLGQRLGQQVGAEFKKQIARDVAEAVRAVEAAATAARAEAVARAEAQQARITEQAVATAISNLIRNSDQRAGRNVSPVLQ